MFFKESSKYKRLIQTVFQTVGSYAAAAPPVLSRPKRGRVGRRGWPNRAPLLLHCNFSNGPSKIRPLLSHQRLSTPRKTAGISLRIGERRAPLILFQCEQQIRAFFANARVLRPRRSARLITLKARPRCSQGGPAARVYYFHYYFSKQRSKIRPFDSHQGSSHARLVAFVSLSAPASLPRLISLILYQRAAYLLGLLSGNQTRGMAAVVGIAGQRCGTGRRSSRSSAWNSMLVHLSKAIAGSGGSGPNSCTYAAQASNRPFVPTSTASTSIQRSPT